MSPSSNRSAASVPTWPTTRSRPKMLASIFGRERVVGQVGTLAAERLDDGDIRVSNVGTTYVGELDGRMSERARALARVLSAGGIPAEAIDYVVSAEWSKVVNVTGAFGVDLLARTGWSRSMKDPHLGRAFLLLLREAAAIARAEGVALRDLPGI